MREIIFLNSISLYATDWVELRRIRAPELKINGYDFIHEKRCQGNIVAFLPFEKANNEFKFLLRKEAVPCWELDRPLLCSFTGGVDKDLTPYKCFIKELEEEAGYIVDVQEENRVYDLGVSFSTKSSDSTYWLYAVDITNFPEEKIRDLYVETELEQASTNEWIDANKIHEAQDPFVSQIVIRLLAQLN